MAPERRPLELASLLHIWGVREKPGSAGNNVVLFARGQEPSCQTTNHPLYC